MAWKIACTVAMRAICLWKRLNVEKCQPVIQIKTLLRPLNIHIKGKLEIAMMPVRSAIYLHI